METIAVKGYPYSARDEAIYPRTHGGEPTKTGRTD
jgi:hypothetical protein